jgi:hypothetical protein
MGDPGEAKQMNQEVLAARERVLRTRRSSWARGPIPRDGSLDRPVAPFADRASKSRRTHADLFCVQPWRVPVADFAKLLTRSPCPARDDAEEMKSDQAQRPKANRDPQPLNEAGNIRDPDLGVERDEDHGEAGGERGTTNR